MSTEDFDYLLNKIKLQISKKDTVLRKAISAEERFAVTLRFLATGDSFQNLSSGDIKYCAGSLQRSYLCVKGRNKGK
jgi:hypothetical protein